MPTETQNLKPQYDLEERTAKFGENVILLAKNLNESSVNRPLITQLIRSATSIGANYAEGDGAESKKDFKYKLSIAKKEAKETKHWLRMLTIANPEIRDQARILWKESQEFVLILSSIIKKVKL